MADVENVEKKIPLGKLLIKSKKITEEQLLKALEVQRNTTDRLGHTLINLGYITEDELINFLENQFGIPAVRINKKMLNPILIKKTIPENICRKYRLIPILIENNKLTIAATNPYDLSFKDEIKFTTDYNIDIVLSPENSVLEAINHTFGKKEYSWQDEELEKNIIKSNISVAKTLDIIFLQAFNMNAREIQLEFFENKFDVLFITTDNIIHSNPLPAFYYKVISIRIRQLSSLNQNDKSFQEGILRKKIYNKIYTIRVLIFPTRLGENIILKFP